MSIWKRVTFCGLSACLTAVLWQAAQGQQADQTPAAPAAPQPLRPAQRIRLNSPIRLGGVYTLGLGEKSHEMEESAKLGVRLSEENAKWIAANLDVIALHAGNIAPETFREFYKAQQLITPLLILDATAAFEQENARGNVGGWKPEMAAWTLRDSAGKEIPHPVKGGHWMDFQSPEWAAHWKANALRLARHYGAQGVVAARLPVNNFFVGTDLKEYKTVRHLVEATGDWLKTAYAPGQYLLIPDALGFENLTGGTTLPLSPERQQPNLPGRLWDAYFPKTDGAWSAGWLSPYWSEFPVDEAGWEIALEAADRAGKIGQVFIAACAYRNDAELEYGLASYLLVVRRQGRVVFQPMPLRPDERRDAGYSLALLRREVQEKSRYFNVELGVAYQERHIVPADGGPVWRRAFQNGAAYVNSHDTRSVTLQLGGDMERLSGEKVRQVFLPPHSGVVLLYPKVAAKKE